VLHYVVSDIPPSLKVLQEILNWKPNLKIKSERDRRLMALHMTVYKITEDDTGERMDILRCLLEHPNGYGPDYMFQRVGALRLAVGTKDYNLAAIEYLSNIIDVRSRDNGGNTVLHLAVRRHEGGKIVSVLLRSPYAAEAVNIQNGSGKTVLHDAVIHCTDTDTVLVIADKADVNMRDGDGKTPLHYAVQCLKPRYVSILLNRMADVSVRDGHGETAFVLACCGKQMHEQHQLSIIFALYCHGVTCGELPNMV